MGGHAERPQFALPSTLARPARRALADAGYTRLDQLAGVGEAELRRLHGIGPNALAQLRRALADHGLTLGGEQAEDR
ncbi:MAG: DNA-binding protein [Chloroflexota bacterium]|nr:DNA-binding protein [Chloroflexota bacterium]